MRSRPALAALLVLALPFALGRRAPAAAAPPGPAPPAQGVPVPEPLPWSARGSPGAAYAALLQLLREEDAGEGWGGAAEGRPLRPVPARSGPRPAGAAHPLRSLPGPPAPPQKRDMHDFFVGLMGKRAAEPGRPAGRGSGGPSPRCSPGPPAAGGAPLRAV
ncbi:tachykinin-3 isoform 2-T2 [Ciconia maguari]